ncbi:MFS transporter [Engelhardtia mirabilis]|uniref:Vacuole effluxer Atg22 like protein n=1 Tax=Engelhardtia mirabilis TaxID=2528011 RepID=A0A518BRJ9_9BACT|nr:Vacuole effluxer Atg22 like protein [Planctomycetes bacterium Pla133]QDV03909.1 Vacuole effluxer Atg22 like protein [Planctomycetes bacterium Pla86]
MTNPSDDRPASAGGGVLSRLALDSPPKRAWALYDWANSAMMTVIVTAVFPIYFERVASEGLTDSESAELFSLGTTIALLTIALLAPLLGALGDYRAIRKRLLGCFLVLGVAATAAMFLIGPGDAYLAVVLFGLANIGASGSFVFYDALLPHVAEGEEMDRLSTSAYSLGYLGGGLLLALNLAWIIKPELFGLPSGEGLTPAEATLPTRLAFLSVALWWGVFSIPLFLRVPEPPRLIEPDETGDRGSLRVAVVRLGETLRELRSYRHAFLMMVAFLIYNDGIGTIIRMSVFFGGLLDLDQSVMLLSILLVQFVGVPCAIGFGRLAARIGTRPAILVGVGFYLLITLLAYGMQNETHFLVLAISVGLVMGGTQALSRSLFASMIPRHKSGEFFAIFAVLEKFAGVLGPAAFFLVVRQTDEPRLAILSVLPFFVVGGLILKRVDIEAGRAAAREADRDLLLRPR